MVEVSKFVENSLSLLALERQTEVSNSVESSCTQIDVKKLEFRGLCLQKLKVASESVGLYGRDVVTFELATHGRRSKESLPSSLIGSGDIVGVFAGNKALADLPLSGVVTRCSESAISVAFDLLPQSVCLSSHDGSLLLIRLANDVTYRRIKRSLEELKGYHSGPAFHLVKVLFGEALPSQTNPRFSKFLDCEPELTNSVYAMFPFINSALDASQRRAVVFALSRPDVAIIHGPPGTGKTTTVVEVILQAVRMGSKVLACAPSNIAVDNLVERLALKKAKVVRIGHPARLVDSVLRYSLDALISASDSAQIVQDVRKEIQTASVQSSKAHNSSQRRKWRGEVKTLRKELQEREEKVLKEILSGADVVLATVTGASMEGPMRYLPDEHFDLVVIDECAQALEASCWIPLLRAAKCVLAGDHMQLPPTIHSREAAREGLSVTLMERLVKLYGSEITTVLTMQYRMHTSIMAWPSHVLYENQLEAHSSVAEHLLRDLDGVAETGETSVPLLFIDTAGCDLRELDTPDEESKGNEGEADLVLHHLKALLAAGVSASDIAVIAPYNLQVELIRQRLGSLQLDSKLEVRSVDGFQGREKEAVIISFTRSNKKGECGFLSEQRRINVAITRARRHLALIGDSETVCNEPFIKGLIDHCHECGEVWSAHEFLHDSTFEEAHHYKPRPKAIRKPAKKQAQKQLSAEMMAKKSKERQHTPGGPRIMADKALEDRLKDELIGFVEQEEAVMSFPPSLSSAERRIVHQLCENLGLFHISRGEGNERFIEVKKKATSGPSQSDDNDENVEDACCSCGKTVPTIDLEVHCIECEKQHSVATGDSKRQEKNAQQARSEGATCKEPKSKPRQTKKKPTAKGHKTDTPDDNLDAMLAEMTLSDSTCGFSKCKKTINLIGLRCQFCNCRFCMEHSIPEVHGCSDSAKKYARQQKSKERHSKHTSLDPAKRAQLQRKLDKKIANLSSGRQTQRGGQERRQNS